jgi:hypothetical protein
MTRCRPLASLLLLGGLPLSAQPAWSPILTPAGALARDLARAGRSLDAALVVDVLKQLACPEHELKNLQAAIDRQARDGKVKPEQLARGVDDLVKALWRNAAKLPPESQPDYARAILRLDAQHGEAHKALAHERVGSRWLPPADVAGRQRLAAVVAALEESEKLAVDVQTAACTEPLLVQPLGRGGHEARVAGLVLRGPAPAGWYAQALRDALRIRAFAQWCLTGKVEAGSTSPVTWYVFEDVASWERAVDKAIRDGHQSEGSRKTLIEGNGFAGKENTRFVRMPSQDELVITLAWGQWAPRVHAAFAEGLLHFSAIALRGNDWPAPRPVSGNPGIVTAEAGEEGAAERELLRLADAGLLGSRIWLGQLVQKSKDPPLQRVWHSGSRGARLKKLASWCEWLVAQDLLGKLVGLNAGAEAMPAAIEQALGRTPAQLEEQWREWVAGEDNSLRARLLPPAAAAMSAADKDLLDQINKARRLAIDGVDGLPRRWNVPADPLLSFGAELLAREEAAGEAAWSRRNSATGAGKSGKEIVERWLGQLDARVLLLDPGVQRVGIGRHGDAVAVDLGSCRRDELGLWFMTWPFAGMKNVPRAMTPQARPPVAGAAAELGYPLTLQLGIDSARLQRRLKLTLFEVRPSGRLPIACHHSAPHEPLDPAYAPRGVYFLIPKAPLQGGVEHRVEVDFENEKKTFGWSFFTAK